MIETQIMSRAVPFGVAIGLKCPCCGHLIVLEEDEDSMWVIQQVPKNKGE